MWIVRLALRRPYTFVVMALLIAVLGIAAIVTMTVDIFPAINASEGRRRRRKRDTTPDAIGMSLKRQLLAQSVDADPDPEAFEAWLLERCLTGPADASMGVLRAMAREVLAEWQFAVASADYREWLAAGAPSEDRGPALPATLAPRPSSQNVDGR